MGAKKSAKTADDNAKNAATALANAEKTPVQFSAIPLDKIDSSNCQQLFSHLKANSNYNTAKATLKCKCKASKGMDDAFAKCTQDEASQKKNWRMAHHMECVTSGSLTLTDKGTGSGKCPC